MQCAFRPPVAIAENRQVDISYKQLKAVSPVAGKTTPIVGCPRCALEDVIPLEKLRPHYNTCYRCRACGHIFSPGMPEDHSKAGVATG